MNKKLRAAAVSFGLGWVSVAAVAGGQVTWSVGVNLPPAQVVLSNGPVYHYPPQPVYRAPPPVVYYPAPRVYYPPPQVIYRPAPVYGHPPAFGGWVHERPPRWHRGHEHGHRRDHWRGHRDD
ncbi:MAG: hypothetical protein HEQ39_15485 [Rhizobacter sp.]